MSGLGSKNPKSKDFGEFLEVYNNATNARSNVSAHASPPVAPATSSVAPRTDSSALRNAAILSLATGGGALPVSALLDSPFESLDQLMDIVNELQRYNLVALSDGLVHLTTGGRQVAQKLRA